MFNLLINDLDDGAECTVSKFADDTKLGEVLDAPDGFAPILRDLDRLGKWADGKHMKLKKEKCQVLRLQRNKPMHEWERSDWLESSLAEKDLRFCQTAS
ncbi:mitochondrial enolase superfamily member 1 [Grus japonensis]|uniref:Mitochondrial enolase superfamily member 1 n=1 Tax=Grus japonensis TaxID=30415 RepID=A0ABC9WSA3_GRUJA